MLPRYFQVSVTPRAHQIQVGGEKIADVLQAERQHRHPVDPRPQAITGTLTPSGWVTSGRKAGAAQFHPAQAGVTGVHLHRRLGVRK